jgi:hypothetical protein
MYISVQNVAQPSELFSSQVFGIIKQRWTLRETLIFYKISLKYVLKLFFEMRTECEGRV